MGMGETEVMADERKLRLNWNSGVTGVGSNPVVE